MCCWIYSGLLTCGHLDSSTGIVTRLWERQSGDPWQGQQMSLQNIETAPGAHPTSCLMGTAVPSWRFSGCEVQLTAHIHQTSRLSQQLSLHSSMSLHGMQRDSFTFTFTMKAAHLIVQTAAKCAEKTSLCCPGFTVVLLDSDNGCVPKNNSHRVESCKLKQSACTHQFICFPLTLDALGSIQAKMYAA
jgi:hypothetical protein